MKTFKLPYWVSNGGDGSANVRFCGTLAKAQEKDEAQSEGWGESSAGYVTLKVVDNKLYFQTYGTYNPQTKTLPQIWVEVKEI